MNAAVHLVQQDINERIIYGASAFWRTPFSKEILFAKRFRLPNPTDILGI
jgi:hypothetical protein